MKTTDVPVDQLEIVVATYMFLPPEVLAVWQQDNGMFTVSKAAENVPDPLPDADDGSQDTEGLGRSAVGPEMQTRAESGDAYLLAVKHGDALYTVRTAALEP